MTENIDGSNTVETRPEDGDLQPPQQISKAVIWINKARRVLLVIGIIYAGAVLLLCTPFFQRHAVYLNAIRIPLFPNYDLPEKYGLAPNKTWNMRIPTSDGESLGAWFILSDRYYHTLPTPPTKESLPTKHIPVAVQKHPTILFLHGNAGTRAFSARVQHYSAFSSRLGANVLAIDYRGFADSTGIPSEEGLVRDARAGWDWLVRKGIEADDILIVGHSLGTGVAAGLVKELTGDGIACKGVVFLAPFTSIQQLLQTYHIFGVLPLMKPLGTIPWATDVVNWALIHKFDTLKTVTSINVPVVIAHAEDDWDIPDSHSDALFGAFLEGELPGLKLPAVPIHASKEDLALLSSSIEARREVRDHIVRRTQMGGFGYVEKFWDESHERNVVLVKAMYGGHDHIGAQEGVQDVIGQMFGFF